MLKWLYLVYVDMIKYIIKINFPILAFLKNKTPQKYKIVCVAHIIFILDRKVLGSLEMQLYSALSTSALPSWLIGTPRIVYRKISSVILLRPGDPSN